MDSVLPNLAIGNFVDAENPSLSEAIDAVICIRENCGCAAREDVSVISRPLVDGPGNRSSVIAEILDHLHDAVVHGDRVLVHCHAGRSRSVIVVARYLMATRAMTREQAIQAIASVREISLTPGIDGVLKMPWSP